MGRKLKREVLNVSLNLDASLETARAGLAQLRGADMIDVDEAVASFETLINAVTAQVIRLRSAIQ